MKQLIIIAMLALTAHAQTQCGKERWPVKTLADGATARALQVSSIAELSALPSPGKKALLQLTHVRLPAEQVQYSIQAQIVGFKQEADGDYHIVLKDGARTGAGQGARTMIAELPSPDCVASRDLKAQFRQLRAEFATQAGHPTAKYKKLAHPIAVHATGYGFFDFIHGQTGVAGNGFELHPLMEVQYDQPQENNKQ